MKATILKVHKLYYKAFINEKSGGIALIFVTLLSLFLANSAFGDSYNKFWSLSFAGHDLAHWINDGLMTVFFLMIGLEIEKEIYQGELSDMRKAALPFFAAVGGMLIPVGIFSLFNNGTIFSAGAAIPMATDIAFAIGILSLLGNKVPISLKIFLTALAIIDDLGSILVIAIFYSSHLSLLNLGIAATIFAGLLIMNKLKVYKLTVYIIGGAAMWYFMYLSGVHATITGVLLAFAIPFGDGKLKSPSHKVEHHISKYVAFMVLPVFAMANTGVKVDGNWLEGFTDTYSLGIILGLLIGKPLGIILFSLLGVGLGISSLPKDIKWSNIIGVGILAGIGFTMSIFITILSYSDIEVVTGSKIAILASSLVAGIIGFIYLNRTLTPKRI